MAESCAACGRPLELLTPAEHEAVELAGRLANLLAQEVVGQADSRTGDMAELVTAVHDVQARVLASAAGRAYPELYRTLGGLLGG